MSFLELAKKRYSSRKYKDIPVEEEKILKILDAARVAPSAANRQPVFVYVVSEKENLEKIRAVYHREWYKEAPVVFLICADHSKGWIRSSDNKDHCDIDIAIAVDHMTLQAAELGLGSCWICNFDVQKCKSIFNLPETIEPVVLLPIAYPLDNADIDRHLTQRKPIGEFVKFL